MSSRNSLAVILGAILLFMATMVLGEPGQVAGLNVVLSVALGGVGVGGLVRSSRKEEYAALQAPDLVERLRELEERLH